MMHTLLDNKRLEIKYLFLTLVLVGGVHYLSRQGVLSNVEAALEYWLQGMIRFGLLGVFIGAVIANSTSFICVPYTLLVVTMIWVDRSWPNIFALSAAAGLGAGLGEIISYGVTRRVASRANQLPRRQWVQRLGQTIETHPRLTPLLIFVFAVSFLPDDVVSTPLALVRYPIRKMLLPMLTGKVLHSLWLIVVITLGQQTERLGLGGGTQMPLILTVLIVLLVLYQGEKAAPRLGDYSSTTSSAAT